MRKYRKLNLKWDVQATDFYSNTALAWAARRGYEGVVRYCCYEATSMLTRLAQNRAEHRSRGLLGMGMRG